MHGFRTLMAVGSLGRNQGFALIEMIAVLAIMAILAGAIAPVLLQNLDRDAGEREREALAAIGEGVRQYYLNQNGGGTLPPEASWTATTQLAGTYVAGVPADLATNERGVARLYRVNYPSIGAIPRVTLVSHLRAGGTALGAGDVPAACVGSAAEDTVLCTPPGTAFATDVVAADMRVLNLNLAAERQRLIDDVQRRFLNPLAALLESLPADVCQGIVDQGGNGHAANAIDGGTVDAAITAAGLTLNDPWGQVLRVNKSGPALTIWSYGPDVDTAVAAPEAVPPVNPLFVAASCASDLRVQQDLQRVRDAVVGFIVAQDPYALPTAGEYAALTVDKNDPWQTAITYSPNVPAAGGFTLTSPGPDQAAGGGDDVSLAVTVNELSGELALQGKSYPPPSQALCNSLETQLNVCNTVLNYVLNAVFCNSLATQHRELGCK